MTEDAIKVTDGKLTVNGEQLKVTAWKLEVEHHLPAWAGSLEPIPLDTEACFSATFEVDPDTYERLVGPELLYTVTQRIDLNPWHRQATGWRKRLRRIRDIALWDFRRRVLRRSPVEILEFTVPNCRLAQL